MSKQKGAFGKVRNQVRYELSDEEVLKKFNEYIASTASTDENMNKPVPMKKKGWWQLW